MHPSHNCTCHQCSVAERDGKTLPITTPWLDGKMRDVHFLVAAVRAPGYASDASQRTKRACPAIVRRLEPPARGLARRTYDTVLRRRIAGDANA